MTTQTFEQTEAFPRTALDVLNELAGIQQAEFDKAVKALDALADDEKITRRYEKAEERLAAARELVRDIDRAIEEVRAITEAPAETSTALGKSVMQEAAEIVNSGAFDTEAVTVTASVSPAVNPVTGEVDAKNDLWTCPTCHGDGQLPDKTGGGRHRCKDCRGTGHAEPSCDNCTTPSCNLRQRAGSSTMGCQGSSWMHGEMMGELPASEPNVSVVVVLYPGSDEPVVTKIGEHTRYSELVADYLAEAHLDDAIAEYWVYGEDDPEARDLTGVISRADYGKRLLVEVLPDSVAANKAESAV